MLYVSFHIVIQISLHTPFLKITHLKINCSTFIFSRHPTIERTIGTAVPRKVKRCLRYMYVFFSYRVWYSIKVQLLNISSMHIALYLLLLQFAPLLIFPLTPQTPPWQVLPTIRPAVRVLLKFILLRIRAYYFMLAHNQYVLEWMKIKSYSNILLTFLAKDANDFV